MAKRVQVTEKFSIGENIYPVGGIYTFSDELATKNSAYLTEDIQEMQESTTIVEDIANPAKKSKKEEK